MKNIDNPNNSHSPGDQRGQKSHPGRLGVCQALDRVQTHPRGPRTLDEAFCKLLPPNHFQASRGGGGHKEGGSLSREGQKGTHCHRQGLRPPVQGRAATGGAVLVGRGSSRQQAVQTWQTS